MENKTLPNSVLIHISNLLSIGLKSLIAVIELTDDGGTVPFIARYRKEQTGNLDEVQIQAIQEKLEYFRELEDRRATVLASIQEQGKLTDELKKKIEATMEKSELEDLYLPYKPKRRTKASIARDRGLEPLSIYLMEQVAGPVSLADYAATFVDPVKEVNSVEEALEGARNIVSEVVSETADYRKAVRAMMAQHGVVTAKAIEGVPDPEGKYKMYAEFSEAASKIPSHRMLAIRRGAKEGILYFEIELDRAKPVEYLKAKTHKAPGDWARHLDMAIEDGYDRLMNPSIQTEIRLDLKDRSDEEAIKVFRENLENLLLAPPAGSLRVLGLDPGIRSGCKVAVVDETGKMLDHSVIYPHEPKNDIVGSVRVLSELMRKHAVRAIAIGNGTASRETDQFVKDFLKQSGLSDVFTVVVSEAGASVYSASEIARQEFPDLDLTVRGAISIARRLQDPLAELVKVDPKAIGVGQYQHDVDQRKLKQGLEATVESCVNRVGVDLNTASWALLKHVSGISERTAIKIVEFRNEKGRFASRTSLMAVPGFGPKTFEQAAGFLRIQNGDNPLDASSVHPEAYPVVEKILADIKRDVKAVMGDGKLLKGLDAEKYADERFGVPTVTDILKELEKPGRDPRPEFKTATFQDGVEKLSDLQPGMILEGVVTNVAAFGAFVDIGVHQDGLIHISALAEKFVKDPRDVVKAGQVVKVKVLEVDAKRNRVALTMRLNDTPTPKSAGGSASSAPGNMAKPRASNGFQASRSPSSSPRQPTAAVGENAMAAAFAKLKERA